jgi:hypothetical protein
MWTKGDKLKDKHIFDIIITIFHELITYFEKKRQFWRMNFTSVRLQISVGVLHVCVMDI